MTCDEFKELLLDMPLIFVIIGTDGSERISMELADSFSLDWAEAVLRSDARSKSLELWIRHQKVFYMMFKNDAELEILKYDFARRGIWFDADFMFGNEEFSIVIH